MTDDLSTEITRLLTCLQNPLTLTIRDLEQALSGSDGTVAAQVVADAGIDHELLGAAVVTRQHLGRINDLINASAISLSLPTVLGSDEVVQGCPSLAAGNDPTRPYDLPCADAVASDPGLVRRGGYDDHFEDRVLGLGAVRKRTAQRE